MTDNKFSNLNIDQILAGFKNKTFSSFELASYYLARIKNDKLNAFISVNEHVLEEAKQADQKIAQGEMALLTGVPIAIKDILLVKGQRATGASKMLANYIAPYTATAVKRLEDQGAIILGKTNCDEFAMGSSNENSAFGPVLNPHDITRVPGGSSGGSAVAVAADLAPIALGTDTAGSSRQPASFCGLVGLKPSYGRVSRYGSMAMASSLDQIGPMAKSVKDAAYLLQVIAGKDKYDLSASYNTVPDYLNLLKTQDPHKLKVGLPKEYFSDALAPSIKQALDKTIDFLHEQNIVVEKVSLPYTEYALATYYILMPAELSSNLARFDGLRFGHHESNDLNLDDWYKKVRATGFSAESKRRIMLGTYILSAGYYDAYYKQAQKLRTVIKQDFQKVFTKVDVLLTPTTPTTAFKLDEKLSDPLSMYLADIFTVSANIAGICGLNLPMGVDENKLPIGIQLLADAFQEEKLFVLGNFIEQNII
ncbi:MAG: Glutamyl-tRNA(Gln) amidotransferase subunit A [Parcubacteria group bacterium GW2011_GWA2_36_10]|nr:MAG: Glutamyl-tRNA(Gln) amidotransferase subunit A [Parcubacteria group bacterium GW2011_GWA2_36_10]